jgi:hypothetical protein
VNWGKALVGRAELAADRVAATKLYNAAIDKFEAVLEEDPEMLVAKYRCALAMQVRKQKGHPGQQQYLQRAFPCNALLPLRVTSRQSSHVSKVQQQYWERTSWDCCLWHCFHLVQRIPAHTIDR